MITRISPRQQSRHTCVRLRMNQKDGGWICDDVGSLAEAVNLFWIGKQHGVANVYIDTLVESAANLAQLIRREAFLQGFVVDDRRGVRNHRYCIGGYLKDIPQPYTRRWFDDPTPRLVRTYIERDYQHFYYFARIEEEDNPIWNRESNTWQCAWDDANGQGKRFSARFQRYAQTTKYIQAVLGHFFQSSQYAIDMDKSIRIWRS